MKKKKLPGFVTGSFVEPFFQSKMGRLITNWIFQGMLYMNTVEIIFKLFVDVVLLAGILFIIGDISVWSVIGGVFLAHTINWIINCQPIALIRHLDWGHNNAEHFIGYIEKMHQRIKNKTYIKACASYGSLSTGKYHPRSDIDIRFIMKQGIINRCRTAALCFYERFRAFLFRFPLDLYAFDMWEAKKKMSNTEAPVVFFDPDGVLRDEYEKTVEFNDFSKKFRSLNV